MGTTSPTAFATAQVCRPTPEFIAALAPSDPTTQPVAAPKPFPLTSPQALDDLDIVSDWPIVADQHLPANAVTAQRMSAQQGSAGHLSAALPDCRDTDYSNGTTVYRAADVLHTVTVGTTALSAMAYATKFC